VRTTLHNTHDRFAFALARLAAERILEEPSRVKVGLQVIERWREKRGDLTPASAEWESIIRQRTPHEIAALLVAQTEEGQRLRSSHPFIRGPFFTEAERLRLIEATHAV
jgi:hypothetical protein